MRLVVFSAHKNLNFIYVFKLFISTYYRWFIIRPMKLENAVPVPALRGDELHTMTVLPYLIAYHYGSDESPQFVTAHEMNG